MASAPKSDSNNEKFDLNTMLKEIKDDMACESADLRQEIDISQAVITELMLANIKKKKDLDA